MSATRIWPAASLAEIEALLCAPGQPFEMETVSIRGVSTRTWRNQPPSLAALARLARAHGERTFLIHEGERVGYEAWFRATAALAAHLRDLGIERGDRVALAMRNLPEWPVAFFAITSLGAIAVPLNAWWTAAELCQGLAHAGARLLICDGERRARIASLVSDLPSQPYVIVSRGERRDPTARALEDMIGTPGDYGALPDIDLPDLAIDADDCATIFYTSGTTGLPKGALGTHRNILTCTLSGSYLSQRNQLRRGEPVTPPRPAVTLVGVPLFHVTACASIMMGTLALGGTMVLMRRWDAAEALALIERERVAIAGGVPTIAWQLLEHPNRDRHELGSLTTIYYGGAPAAPDLVRLIDADLKAMPGIGWGMTETMATVTSHSGEDYLHRPESCGPPLPVADLRIMDPAGLAELPVGAVGELWARGPQIAAGYWNDPAATSATFVDGWIRTGDLARLDDDGFCFIVDRLKDVVLRGGENIHACEVENALYGHPAVVDVALVGIPHRTLGEEPAAVVHLAPGTAATEAELRDWVRGRLAPFKVPARILFSDDMLPRNASGKIVKSTLRALFAAPVEDA